MLDYYYDLFKNEYNNVYDEDHIHEFCDTTASNLLFNECIQLINERFGNQLIAIKEYMDEYGDIPIYDNDIKRTYHILAYLALKRYIDEENDYNRRYLDNDTDNDADDENDNDNDNDEVLSQASTIDINLN